MRNPNNHRTFLPLLLEHLESRLAPASSLFEDQITNIFRYALNRSPAPDGLQAFASSLEGGVSLHQVTKAILQSEEHQRSVITCYYRELLNREPDSEGLNAFMLAVKNGATSEEVLAGFLSSEEYIGQGVSDEAYVDSLYQKILGRAPDEQGKADHLRSLQKGVSRFDVALGFLTSTENDAVEVNALYLKILGRTPSDTEVHGWVNRLTRADTDQQDVVVGFLSSPEGAKRIGGEVVFGTDLGNEGWWLKEVGLNSLTVEPLLMGTPTESQAQIQLLANQIRAVETFSNPNNMGQIVAQLRPNDYPNLNAKNNASEPTTGTFGASAYPLDRRNTPGAFQVDLANIGKVDPFNKNYEVFGQWDGTAGAPKNPNSTDVEIAFSKDTLSTFLGISVDANGLITSITPEAASVFLNNEAVALVDNFDPLKNPLIGQNIDTLKREQLSLYLAGRVAEDATVGLNGDPRIAPGAVVSTSLDLQYQTSRSYMYGVLRTYASNDYYKEVFAKAQKLFDSTLKITSSQTAFGVNKGDIFWSRFNAAFITGGAYVSGVNAMFGLFSGLVQANETGTGTWVADPLKGITITFKKVKDGALASDKIFTVDKTPPNNSDTFPSIFHYGAVLSPIKIDDLLNDPNVWGVTGRTGVMGYARLGETQLQRGGGTLPTGAAAYSYLYQGLETEQTLNIVGGDSYRLVPAPPTPPVITVNNEGYSSTPSNYSQRVTVGEKIDMSAYGLTIEEAYPNMFYADTGKTVIVAHVSDKSFISPPFGLYLYYVNGANGDLAVATQVISQYEFWIPEFKASYRVGVANTDILGHPDSAQQFGQHFIMTPPPVIQGSGILDASGLTGSLRVQTNSSLTRVFLGQGTNQVDAGSLGTGVDYVLNSQMAANGVSSLFKGLRLGTDKVDLTRFASVANLAARVVASFDNKVGGSSTAKLYPQFTKTVEVSFTSGGKSYKFQVLNSGKTDTPDSTLVASVLSSIRS